MSNKFTMKVHFCEADGSAVKKTSKLHEWTIFLHHMPFLFEGEGMTVEEGEKLLELLNKANCPDFS